LLVLLVVEGEVLEWKLCLVSRSPELGQGYVASVDDEGKVLTTTLLIEEEVLFAFHAEPVEELQGGLDELQVLEAPLGTCVLVVPPDETNDPKKEATATLKGLDAGELRDGALLVEVLDPATKVLDHGEVVLCHNHSWLHLVLELSEVVEAGNNVGKADELRDPESLLSKKSTSCTNAVQIPDDGRAPLLEHEPEEADCPVLQLQVLAHLS
jgi:hypothetical protein